MNEKDAIQELWQSHEPENEKEKTAMWMQLVKEKRSGFDALVQARNQSEYMVTLLVGPVLALLAGKAKFPVVQLGYGLLSATMPAFAAATPVVLVGDGDACALGQEFDHFHELQAFLLAHQGDRVAVRVRGGGRQAGDGDLDRQRMSVGDGERARRRTASILGSARIAS